MLTEGRAQQAPLVGEYVGEVPMPSVLAPKYQGPAYASALK
jgi:hypothetical protein